MSKNTTLLGIFKNFKFIENYLVTQNRAEKLFLQILSENTTLLENSPVFWISANSTMCQN